MADNQRHEHGVVWGRSACRLHHMSHPFVPDDFQAPSVLEGPGFHLEPLGPHHNDRDHEAWMSSIEWIRSTPGYGPDTDWPATMSSDANLCDLEMHARDFENREGFTYSVLDGDAVIGCVYIYPTTESGFDASIKSWVTASRKEMDIVVHRSVARWINDFWPFDHARYAHRPDSSHDGERDRSKSGLVDMG